MPNSKNRIETLKKAFLIGVGASVVTAEKVGDFVRDVVDDLVARGEITALDARQLANDLKKRAGKEKSSLSDNVEAAVKKAVKSLGLVTQDDLRQLRRELSAAKKPAAAKSAARSKTAAPKVKKAAPKKAARKPAAKKR